MDLSEFVGVYILNVTANDIQRIVSVNSYTYDICTENGHHMTYIELKYGLINGYLKVIDTDSYVNFKNAVTKDYRDLIRSVENSKIPITSLYINNQGSNSIVFTTDYNKTLKPKTCECGGNKIGLKDYQVGHASYCNVYHGNKE